MVTLIANPFSLQEPSSSMQYQCGFTNSPKPPKKPLLPTLDTKEERLSYNINPNEPVQEPPVSALILAVQTSIKALKEEQWNDIFEVAMSFQTKRSSKSVNESKEEILETDLDKYDELVDPCYIPKSEEVVV
ncbi:hypothetical protein BJV77DRAFT_965347 [Russula vinacea]|nr:hypothetical protein BJV77DRAFT_965347 [Russula vinacea]